MYSETEKSRQNNTKNYSHEFFRTTLRSTGSRWPRRSTTAASSAALPSSRSPRPSAGISRSTSSPYRTTMNRWVQDAWISFPVLPCDIVSLGLPILLLLLADGLKRAFSGTVLKSSVLLFEHVTYFSFKTRRARNHYWSFGPDLLEFYQLNL